MKENTYPRDNKSRQRQTVDFNKLPDEALIRLSDVLQVIPVGRSKWLAGVKGGEYPKPVKISTRAGGWRWGVIKKLLMGFGDE